jgi:hypothetical protein
MMRVERLRGIEDVDREAWRTLEPPGFPFLDYEFLRAGALWQHRTAQRMVASLSAVHRRKVHPWGALSILED